MQLFCIVANLNWYRDAGMTIRLFAGIPISYLIFRPIRKAFKSHPILSPYNRFAAKGALFVGYLVTINIAGYYGDFVGDTYEDR